MKSTTYIIDTDDLTTGVRGEVRLTISHDEEAMDDFAGALAAAVQRFLESFNNVNVARSELHKNYRPRHVRKERKRDTGE